MADTGLVPELNHILSYEAYTGITNDNGEPAWPTLSDHGPQGMSSDHQYLHHWKLARM